MNRIYFLTWSSRSSMTLDHPWEKKSSWGNFLLWSSYRVSPRETMVDVDQKCTRNWLWDPVNIWNARQSIELAGQIPQGRWLWLFRCCPESDGWWKTILRGRMRRRKKFLLRREEKYAASEILVFFVYCSKSRQKEYTQFTDFELLEYLCCPHPLSW